MSINDYVKKITSDNGQDIPEIVWDLILQSNGKYVFLNIISGLENHNKDLAISFANEVIKQTCNS